MPNKPLRGPGAYVPTDRELLAIVQRQPGASLRAICGACWPDLAWTAAGAGADSATGRVRTWQAPTGGGRPGNRVVQQTAAEWLRDRLEDLAARGLIAHAPRHRDEVDLLASLAYVVPGGIAPAAADPLAALARSRVAPL